MQKVNFFQKPIFYLAIILIIAAIILVVQLIYIFKKEPTPRSTVTPPTKENIIQSLSIPASNPGKVPESVQKEIQKSLLVPSKNTVPGKISQEDILKSLSAPAQK